MSARTPPPPRGPEPPPLVRTTVLGVILEAMRERSEERILLLRPGSAEAGRLRRWLHEAGLTAHAVDAAPPQREGIVLDPADKLTLLLEGPRPGADVLPLGDVWPSLLGASEPTPVERALRAALDEGRGLGILDDHLPAPEAAELRRRLLRTAPLLRAPTVPKLTEWTIGIDPGL